jgi:hypothetical protein
VVGSLTFACYADEVAKGSQPPQQIRGKSAVAPLRGSGVRAVQGWRGKNLRLAPSWGQPIELSALNTERGPDKPSLPREKPSEKSFD